MNDRELLKVFGAGELAKEASRFLSKALDALVELEVDGESGMELDEATVAKCRKAIGLAKHDLRVLRRDLRPLTNGPSEAAGTAFPPAGVASLEAARRKRDQQRRREP